MSREQAVGHVAERLDLDESVVMADPAEDAATQRASLLITEILMALEGQDDRWERLESEIRSMSPGRLNQAASTLALDQQLPPASQTRLTKIAEQAETLLDLDPAESNAEGMIKAQGLASLRSGLEGYFKLAGKHVNPDHVDPLSRALWEGMGERSVPAGSSALLNIARYVFQVHAMPEDLSNSEADLPLADIRHDLILRDLASQRVIDHTIPLAHGEALGMDNERRMAYFLNSDLSPYHRAERLFDEVFDDAVTDPVFADIAHGMAASGMLEAAELTLRARIFQPAERAEAQRLVGDALFDNGEAEAARERLITAREIHAEVLEAKGIQNLEHEDAAFLSRLSGSFSRAGFTRDAEDTLESVREFTRLAGGKGQEYSNAYRQIAVAAYNAAREAVERYENASNSVSALRNEAESAMILAEKLIWGLGREPNPVFGMINRIYSTRTMYVALYGELAVRMGLTAAVQRSAEEFEDLLNTSQNLDAAGLHLTNVSEVFVYLDRLADYAALIERGETLHGDHWERASAPRAEVRLYEAREQALRGEIEQAIQMTLDARENPTPSGQLRDLTFDLISREVLRPGGQRLALYLVDEGQMAAALAVTEAAAEIALSQALVDERVDARNDWQFVYLGCRRVAFMFDLAGDKARALEHLEDCAERVEQAMSGSTTPTAQFAESIRLLAAAHFWLDDLAGGQRRLSRFTDIGQVFTGSERVAHVIQRAELLIESGDAELALSGLDDAVNTWKELASSAGSDDEIKEALGWLTRGRASQARGSAANIGLVPAYALLVDTLREHVAVTGEIKPNLRSQVADARSTGVDLIIGEGETPAARDLIADLIREQDRDLETRHVVEALTSLRGFAHAKSLADSEDRSSVRNRLLRIIAEELTGWDDFPGSSMARFDFDGDGRPDFFNPQYAESEWMMSPLQMDDDIDGDGIPDTQDLTPYCPGCMDVGSMSRR
ncbi:hypothetical protein [Ectothiorhodospira sp. BSL-9]|uniref:hypothetical protein n=1 Tax=Ectothiorhodospira sp. BSL-9 TaxID=1442136 RepID=UPI0012E95290|nr:hypothetical protein [Ectothiorhodospira sp. BSL-9]